MIHASEKARMNPVSIIRISAKEGHGIACSGELQKRELKNLGYYHGDKGYRFAGIAKNRLHLQSFEQISSLNSFDMALKSSIYPRIIAVETALKNYTLEEVLQGAESPFLDQIFAQSLNAYKECRGAKKQYKIELLRRLRLRNEMDSLLSQRYKSSVPVIQHFLTLISKYRFGQFSR